jgi:ethanolamine utilization protein EutA
MSSDRHLISVGIDIGTTTTQIVFSQLSLVEVSRAGQIPRVDITNREIIYTSDIFFTPLVDAETIDSQRLANILESEYRKAGITPGQVETGAVIITGETARKKNADLVLNAISNLAGDFVVTVAGPNVEGMIAGRGSGAATYSKKHFTSVVNLDIGGGSANCAVFKQGNFVSSSAMSFGGRVIEINGQEITYINKIGEILIDACQLRLQIGDRPELADLRKITEQMAELAVHLVKGTASPLAERLYQSAPISMFSKNYPLMITGGVGYYYYNPLNLRTVQDVSLHGDIGPLLAESLRQNPEIAQLLVLKPEETQRATVLGASSQTLTLSGSTIWADASILPLKSVPVVRVDLPAFSQSDPAGQSDRISAAIKTSTQRWDIQNGIDHFALSLDFDQVLDYDQLRNLAGGLELFSRELPDFLPLIVIIKRDYAQVLGQTLKAMIGRRSLLVIDQVGLEEGDFIDIGLPLMDGRVVPVIVKTLVFYH